MTPLFADPRPQPEQDIADRRGEQQQGGQVPAAIAKIIRRRAAERGRQIGEDPIPGDRTPHRALEKQRGDRAKQQNGHPIIGSMQNSIPQRLRACLAQSRRIGTRAAAILLVPLAACDQQPPKGQVLASVGGEAITKRDLQAELASAARLGARDDSSGPALDRLVERALLLRVARERELDLSPEYLAAIRRAREDILIDMLNDQVASQVPAPSAAEIRNYVETRPWMFAGRQLLTLDEIVPQGGADALRTVSAAASMEDAARLLGTALQRRSVRADSAQLPAADAAALLGAGAAPVALLQGSPPRLVLVRARQAAPILGGQADKIADAIIRRERLARRLESLVATQRKGAQVRYREGFGPASR